MKSNSQISIYSIIVFVGVSLTLHVLPLVPSDVAAANGPGAKGQKSECRKEIDLACGTTKGEQRKSCIQSKQQQFSAQCQKKSEGEKKIARKGQEKGNKHNNPHARKG